MKTATNEMIDLTLTRLAELGGLPKNCSRNWIGLKYEFKWDEDSLEPVLLMGSVTSLQVNQLELSLYVTSPEFGRDGPDIQCFRFVECDGNGKLDPHWIAATLNGRRFRGSMKFLT
jgi:hypothetical protein